MRQQKYHTKDEMTDDSASIGDELAAEQSPRSGVAVEREAVAQAAKPYADFHGDLPDFDDPLRCVYESGIQYAVDLLAKTLRVDDYEICDGTEEFDGDLGGTMFNIVLAALPTDDHGDHYHPDELPALLALTAPQPDPDARLRRECQTPESVYSFGAPKSDLSWVRGCRVLAVEIAFPFDITDWIKGYSAMHEAGDGDEAKLSAYDQMYAERKRIEDLIHDQMEIVGADAYRVLIDRDAKIGDDRVDYGVRHARWRRTGEGERPVTAQALSDTPA